MTDRVVYRFPITITGFIEMDAEVTVKDGEVGHVTRVIVDEYGWEFAGWPRISPYGDDDLVVQIEEGATRRIEADANIVVPLREAVGNELPLTSWTVSRTVEDDIVIGTYMND